MRLVFAGTPDFAARILSALIARGHEIALVLTQPDRPAGRGLKVLESPVKSLAASHGVDVFQPVTLREAAACERLEQARAHALVVAAYGLILPMRVLESTTLGAINVHASLLPRWRGAAPVQRALMAGDDRTGITIMKMDTGVDTGPTLCQSEVPVGPHDDSGTLLARLAILGSQMIVSALDELESARAKVKVQPSDGVTYAKKIDRTELEIDWNAPAIAIERAIRAFRPESGMSTSIRAAKVKVWSARTEHGEGVPGMVLGLARDGIRVACGSGVLIITELQRAGGRRLAAIEFLRGNPIKAGDRFERQPA